MAMKQSAGLAQGCCCALPLQAWAGHIVAAEKSESEKAVQVGAS